MRSARVREPAASGPLGPRKRLLAFGIAVVSVVIVALASGLTAAGGNGPLCVLNTKLVPEEEVPHVSTSEAKGQAHIKLFADGTVEFKVHILNRAGEAFWGGHIHEAPVGQAGAIVIPLFDNQAGVTDRQFRDRGETTASTTLEGRSASRRKTSTSTTTHSPSGPARCAASSARRRHATGRAEGRPTITPDSRAGGSRRQRMPSSAERSKQLSQARCWGDC